MPGTGRPFQHRFPEKNSRSLATCSGKNSERLDSLQEVELARRLRESHTRMYRCLDALEVDPRNFKVFADIEECAGDLQGMLSEERRRDRQLLDVRFSNHGLVCQLKS